jgi:hypothetical protein
VKGYAEARQQISLTRPARVLVQKRIAVDPASSEALLRECIYTMLAGDVGIGKVILRHYRKTMDSFVDSGANG